MPKDTYNSNFLEKLGKAWKIRNISFCEFMADAVYYAEGHTEIVYSSQTKLEEVFDKIITLGKMPER